MSGPQCIACGAVDGDCNCGREIPTCAHCEIDLDETTCFDTQSGLRACSTRCAVALDFYGHTERCESPACADGAVLTLPPMLCSFCDEPVEGGGTSHVSCLKHARNAIGGEAAALTFAAFGRGGEA